MEGIKQELKPEPEWSRRQWDQVQQLKAGMTHLENKVNALLKKRKAKHDYL